jgi:hypothetical protein
MKRVNTRGIKQAQKCMLMAAVAYNLKKLLKWQITKAIVKVQEMKIMAKKVVFMALSTIASIPAYIVL